MAVAPHVSELLYQDASGVQADIFRVDAGSLHWHFVASSTPQTIARWSEQLPKASLIANGVYFTPAFESAGFLSIAGKRQGSGLFDLKRSGILSLSPEPRIIDTALEPVDLNSLADAGQSYPFLIRDGVSVVSSTSTMAARRTFIGTDQTQNVYVGVISEDIVTLANISKLLARIGIPWQDVLNLDGGPSTGIAVWGATGSKLINSDTAVPIVVVAEP
jgi:hypothetical protein